jgi:lysozyme family protein
LQKHALYDGPVDGIAGDGTIDGAVRGEKNGLTDEIINNMCDQRLAFMRSLRQWSSFQNGWKRRVAEVRKLSLFWDKEVQAVTIDKIVKERAVEAAALPPGAVVEDGSPKALPSETKITETLSGDAATKQITIGGGGLLAWGLSKLESLGDYAHVITGLPPDALKWILGGIIALAFGALILYGVLQIRRVFARQDRRESTETV